MRKERRDFIRFQRHRNEPYAEERDPGYAEWSYIQTQLTSATTHLEYLRGEVEEYREKYGGEVFSLEEDKKRS